MREDLSELNLVGQAAAFRAALDLIRKFAESDATVLIQGETGTGKELAARAIHYLSARRSFAFIPVNCGGLPDTLVENELFGHVRGAYTDARESQRGLVSDAHGGTLFLDEIEALTTKGQVVLLRFLQDGLFRPLGGRSTVEANVRVIAGSNTDLRALCRSGAFREDLFYRLAILPVRMPPLRERPGDVALLAEHFMRRLAARYGKPRPVLDPATLERLNRYHWPGNVRELENLIHREVVLCESGSLSIDTARIESASGMAAGPPDLHASPQSFAEAKALAIEQFERSYLEQALSAAAGNVALAARCCGKERRSFGKLLKKHGIDRDLYSAG